MLISLLPLLACSNPEEVVEGQVLGKVVIPKSAATRTVVEAVDEDGDGEYEYVEREETDVRLLGPVYLGAYSGIDDVSFSYPHPSMGPVVDEGSRGDVFPYGGATVGRLDFACYESVACRVTTGRFSSYDDILDYFRNYLGKPVVDSYGREVMTGETFQQWCYEYFDATSDKEMGFIGEDALSFTEDGDNFVADFALNHTARVEGMVVWGFMDAPELGVSAIDINGAYTTCDDTGGRVVDEYVSEFSEGRSEYFVLNRPSTYIQTGDWVADGQAVVSFDEEGIQTEDIVVDLSIPYVAE